MPEMTPSTREAARRIGVTETALRKAERTTRIAREPDGQWDVDKTRRRLTETADPARSPLASGAGAEGTRDALLNWPARVSGLIAAEISVDPHLLQTILQSHINDLLTEAADRFDPAGLGGARDR